MNHQKTLNSAKTKKSVVEYYSDGETIYYITEYRPETEEVIKQTNYNSDGKLTTEIFYDGDGETIDYIRKYNPQISKLIKFTKYQEDGETIDYITEFKYHPKTNKLIKTTGFSFDRKRIAFIYKHHPNGKLFKRTYYNSDGTIIKERSKNND
ncbi:Conserved hypothetical protein [Candidatus Phytoplasma australiense]|uniref:DUF2963 domain-containing protein n=1 Tax=Phytoplasma australiense TaxID=59748 RepID=B1V9G1_PHYAS|nr:Conserved hypothetical protein [Candidatus Phytoplasma australiense]